MPTFSTTIPKYSPLLNTQLQATVQVYLHVGIHAHASKDVYSLPGTNHALIQGESSNGSFRQRKYVNTTVRSNTDIIRTLEKISNPVTTDNAYHDANLCCTPFSIKADTGSTSYFLYTGANHIIHNDVRYFKVFHPCNGNIKVIRGSNVSTRGTCTTYIPINSDDGTVDHIKVTDTVFVTSSPFNPLPPLICIPEIQNAGHKTNHSK